LAKANANEHHSAEESREPDLHLSSLQQTLSSNEIYSHPAFFALNSFLFLTNRELLHRVRSIVLSRNLDSPQVLKMKNVYEVLRQKELELARLEKEVEALRVAAPLLSDDKDSTADTAIAKPTLTAAATPTPQQPIRIPQPAVAQVQPPTARAAGWEDGAKRWP